MKKEDIYISLSDLVEAAEGLFSVRTNMKTLFRKIPCKVETKGGTIYTAIKISKDGSKVLLQRGGVKKWAFLSELK